MKVTEVELQPLPSKHYETSLIVEVDGRPFKVSICGSGSKPSQREINNGWEPEFGMDHVESVEHLFLARKIMEALSDDI